MAPKQPTLSLAQSAAAAVAQSTDAARRGARWRWVRAVARNRWLRPALSVWLIAAYLHLAQYLFMFEYVSGRGAALLVLPALALELLATWLEEIAQPTSTLRRGWYLALGLRLLTWLAGYGFWVFYITALAQQGPWLKWFAPEFYLQFSLIYRAEGGFALAALAIWLVLYYGLTVRGGRGRLFTALILPAGLSLGLAVHLYNFGGVGGLWPDQLTQQPGVTKYFDVRELSPAAQIHPRELFFDREANALFMVFGCTYCNDLVYYPTLVRRDLATGKTLYFSSSNLRKIYFDPQASTLLVAPWYLDAIYELSRQDLSIVKKHPVVTLQFYWEPMDLLRDGRYAYVVNDVEQALVTYDLEKDQLDRFLNLTRLGLARYGGPAWNLIQSAKTRRLYFTAGPGPKNLYAVDPDSLQILASRGFYDVAGSALVLDDERDLLYYQNGGLNDIYELDATTLETRRTLPGEMHARSMVLDPARRSLYVLGYFSGTVFSIDLDTGRRGWSRRVGGMPDGLALGDGVLWVNSMAGVFQIDLAAVQNNQK